MELSGIKWELFKGNDTNIYLPSYLTESYINRKVGKKLLHKIDKDSDVAMDKIMWFCSYLTSNYMDKSNNDFFDLYSLKLRAELGKYYKKNIIDMLIKVKIIVCDGLYIIPGFHGSTTSKCLGYKLVGNGKDSKKLYRYQLKTPKVIKIKSEFFYKKINAAKSNIIARNLLMLLGSGRVTLPTIDEVKNKAIEMHKTYRKLTLSEINRGDEEKKYRGEYCVYLDYSKRSREQYCKVSYKKNGKKIIKKNKGIRFLDDSINLYMNLFGLSLKSPNSMTFNIPSPSARREDGYKVCPRIFDSISMMPSWIRKMIKIDGQPIVECDFTALHPHIAMKHIGTEEEYGKITDPDLHAIIAKEAGVDRDKVKIFHLSFFNTKIKYTIDADMIIEEKIIPGQDFIFYINNEFKWKNSIRHKIIKYYLMNHINLMRKIITVKYNTDHKFVSKVLFHNEVKLMEEIVKKLNEEDIYVLYVYDALYCKKQDRKIVREVMNEIAAKQGYKTKVSN